MRILLLSIFVTIIFASCGDAPLAADDNLTIDTTITMPLGNFCTINFLNVKDAQNEIVNDTMTAYFQIVTSLDMAMQMQDNDYIEENRDSLITPYKEFLKKRVQSFTNAESRLIFKTLVEINEFAQQMNARIFPKNIKFIKTDGEIYGKETYFTRQNCIIIPAPALKNALRGDTINLRNTLAHEVFHIISRYNKPLQTKLYKRLGFDTLANVIYTDTTLQSRLISNPDGVKPYKIRLNDTLTGIMLAVGNLNFNDSDSFVEHLSWDMYAIKKNKNAWFIQTDSLGESTLDNDWEMPFYQRITTNTEYTLHPDEILASNFSLLMQYKLDKDKPDLEPEGIKLLNDIEQIYKNAK